MNLKHARHIKAHGKGAFLLGASPFDMSDQVYKLGAAIGMGVLKNVSTDTYHAMMDVCPRDVNPYCQRILDLGALL